MSNASERGAAGDDLWVVDVTAPLASGRVREVAADAAARLKLPVEKLVALLENRIGPVTKPLPHASAARVAEVLHLSGAEVHLRPADTDDAAGQGQPPEAHAAEGAENGRAPSSGAKVAPGPSAAADETRPEAAGANPQEAERVPEGSEHAGENAEGAEPASAGPVEKPAPDVREDVAARSGRDGRPRDPAGMPPDEPGGAAGDPAGDPAGDSTVGRASRGRPADGAAGVDDGEAERRPVEDPWGRLSDDEADDEAMLAGWKRTPEPTSRPADRRPADPRPSDSRPSDPDPAAPRPADPRPADARPPDRRPSGASSGAGASDSSRPRPDAAGHAPAAKPSSAPRNAAQEHVASAARPPLRPSTGSQDSDRVPIAQRMPARDEPDEEPSSWSYGLRDPFAEADARERTLRRWVLMIALLIASTIFVILQWAYSRPNIDGRTVAGFDDGLVAYRDGAFVSAARAWTPLAEDGDPAAMYMLGWMAEFGQGRRWSNREAASWYRQAAERGHAPSQLRLADLYRRGLGVDYDLETALDWYLAAARSGIPRAQREAALVLARLDRVDDARVWLARAAAGDADAAAWWKLVSDDGDATNASP